ncbi:GDSL-type esterase/lipase family protein [Sediminicoccus rosea]|jgi:lysophospholipase L1-like esterase|uniref:GDSL-type esterase/lipase family protein n=1 Tax=Sediminicoccus rosea TaxID=1225128 RepID=A0ABZ0PGF4_9PROT|nr:GDSL-type esterase/lipase family protein [Sediminicoccus rosea]WPB84729.1 GDSL-type esterase/lipase family protein [Sediminicoccus rosea]
MLNRRALFLGSAALLGGCGARPEPLAGEVGGPLILAQARPDTGLESVLPARAGDNPYEPLANALRAAGRGQASRALILILGDSHTAGPVMVGHLRELMQARFGAAGPGRLPPGRAQRPINANQLVEASQSGEWTARSALRASNPGPFGLTGFRLTGTRAGDVITLRSSEAAGFDRVHLGLMAGPEAGSFRLRVDELAVGPVTLRSAGPEFRPLTLDAPPRSRELAIEVTGDGPVELLGWGVDRSGRGVLVEGFGINGATLASLDNRDPTIFARELTNQPPALVILAFGTNEAVDADFDEAAYAVQLTRQIQRLRQTLPRSGIMVMGVPDAGRPVRATRRGRPPQGCAAVSPLPALLRVRAAQRSVAQAQRVGFFDWSAEVTRSPCRLPELARGDAPLMRPDLVHFTPDGYRLTAERLQAHLLRGMGLATRTTAT